MFQRLLGSRPGTAAAPATPEITGETAAVRMIIARLEALPPDRARHLAGFAYLMSRAAQADLQVSDAETATMVAALREHGHLDAEHAALVADMAAVEAGRNGATADYLVTREFAGFATREEKLAVLRCCFVVSAADDSISAEEAHVVNEIASELDIDASDLNEVRQAFVGQLSAIRAQQQLLKDR